MFCKPSTLSEELVTDCARDGTESLPPPPPPPPPLPLLQRRRRVTVQGDRDSDDYYARMYSNARIAEYRFLHDREEKREKKLALLKERQNAKEAEREERIKALEKESLDRMEKTKTKLLELIQSHTKNILVENT